VWTPVTGGARLRPNADAEPRVIPLSVALVERKGGTPDVARKYRWLCESADLRVIEQRGWFLVANDLRVIRAWYRDILLSRRDNLVVQRLAREDEIDALVMNPKVWTTFEGR
jgi:hypothetical protein